MPSSDVRSSETSAQNARDKNFQKFTCSKFRGSLISRFGRGSRNSRKFGPRENFPLYGMHLLFQHVAMIPEMQEKIKYRFLCRSHGDPVSVHCKCRGQPMFLFALHVDFILSLIHFISMGHFRVCFWQQLKCKNFLR